MFGAPQSSLSTSSSPFASFVTFGSNPFSAFSVSLCYPRSLYWKSAFVFLCADPLVPFLKRQKATKNFNKRKLRQRRKDSPLSPLSLVQAFFLSSPEVTHADPGPELDLQASLLQSVSYYRYLCDSEAFCSNPSLVSLCATVSPAFGTPIRCPSANRPSAQPPGE